MGLSLVDVSTIGVFESYGRRITTTPRKFRLETRLTIDS